MEDEKAGECCLTPDTPHQQFSDVLLPELWRIKTKDLYIRVVHTGSSAGGELDRRQVEGQKLRETNLPIRLREQGTEREEVNQ